MDQTLLPSNNQKKKTDGVNMLPHKDFNSGPGGMASGENDRNYNPISVEEIDSPPIEEAVGLAHAKGRKNNMKILFIIIFLALLGAGGYYFFSQKNTPEETGAPAVFATATSEPDKNLDTDKDGLPDKIEKVLGTDPGRADTDSDTYNDLDEIKYSHNPLVSGATDKYTPEEWLALKEKIKDTDKDFYEKIFVTETPVVSSSPAAPLISSPAPSDGSKPN